MTVKEEAEKYFNAAAERFINKDYEGAKNYFTKAIESYSKAIDLDVNDKDVYRRRGLTYLSIGDYPKAIDDFTKAIELGANDKDIYDMCGFAYLRIKDFAKAMEDFTKAIDLGANDKDVYFKRGLAYFGMANYRKAISDCTKAIELGGNDKGIYIIRGSAYKHIKNYQKVIEDLTKAINLGAENKNVYDMRGLAYLRIGNYSKAIEDLTRAMKLGSNNKDIYRNRGFAYLETDYYSKSKEDYTKAIEDLTRAMKLGSNNKGIYRNRGFAYLGIDNYPKSKKDYIKAIDDFTTAIKLGAKDKGVYGGRGLAYLGIKDYQKAIKDLTKAIKDFKNNTNLDKDGKEKNSTSDSDYIPDRIPLTDNVHDLVIDILQKNGSKNLPDTESIHLIELICSCSDLMNEIKIEPSEVKGEQFVHYTKAGTLQYLLKKDHSAKLRLNNAVYMNDPEEGQILKKVLCQLDQNNELENLLKDTENIKNYTYLTCFSPYDKRDELPMWIHYGDGGKGVGLVFHNSFFKGTDLYKVQYIDVKNFDIGKLDRKVRKKIRIILNLLRKDEVKNNTNKEFKDYVNIILNYVSYLFKDKAYEYENEVRILNYKDYDSQDIKTDDAGRDIPRLFIEYKQCITDKNCVEVIAGPKAQYTEIAAYAKYVGIPKVSQSEIKYR